jgi:hypothetical protein
MRVALLASTFVLLAGSPAFAQCIHVACATGQTSQTITQQTTGRSDFDAGFEAGLAARHTVTEHRVTVRHVTVRPKAKTTRRHVKRPARIVHRPVVRPHVRTPIRHVSRVTHTRRHTSFTDTIKNRADTYGAAAFGSSTSMGSLMSSSSSFSSSSSVSWIGPTAVTSQNGQTCGWGARVVTNQSGHAQRQAVWVCQCPQGWRPPGY